MLTSGIFAGLQESVQTPKEWDHMPVIQFDYAYLSSVNSKGQQVRMRTTRDTSTGYATACVIDVKGGGEANL